MKIHELKCWQESFLPILQGKKLAEFRRNDRDFKKGDVLHLREWQPEDPLASNPTAHYTQRECLLSVLHIVHGPSFGVPEGYVMLSFEVLRNG